MAVDALDPTWINAPGGVGPTYDAEELRRAQGFTLAAGATPGSSRTGVLNIRDLVVTLSGSNVMVGPGGCAVGTAKGAYVTGLAATVNLGALTPADVTNPRRDRVVLEVLDPDNGGGAGRKAQLRTIDGTPNALAASGGGYPPAPTSPFIDLGYVDVPKSGGGAPVVTALPALTAMAGAPILVRSQAEADALPKWDGATRIRLDLPGRPVQTHDGTKWSSGGMYGSYTPVLTASTTNPSLGSGVALGQYQVAGNFMLVQFFIPFSTTGNVGAGNYMVSLPPGFTYGGLGSAVPVGTFQGHLSDTQDILGYMRQNTSGSNRVFMYWQPTPTTVAQVGANTVSWTATAGRYMAGTLTVPLA